MRRSVERLYGLAKEGADRSDGVMSVLDGLIDLRAPTGTNWVKPESLEACSRNPVESI